MTIFCIPMVNYALLRAFTEMISFLSKNNPYSPGDGWWWWLHNNENVLNATELYIKTWLKWSILCYVYFVVIKHFNLNREVGSWPILEREVACLKISSAPRVASSSQFSGVPKHGTTSGLNSSLSQNTRVQTSLLTLSQLSWFWFVCFLLLWENTLTKTTWEWGSFLLLMVPGSSPS